VPKPFAMARTQAADYDARRAAIVEAAARLFARKGFPGASVAELAAACGASKSLIYHYYPGKEEILFAVMDGHLRALLGAARAVPDGPAEARLRVLTRALMREYAGAAAAQKVLLNELDQLPPERRLAIVAEQRALIGQVEEMVADLAPTLAKPERLAAAMLFFGMINWTHTWWDPGGTLDADRIAQLASDTFLNGLAQAS